MSCNCNNNTHRVLTVTYSGTEVVLTATDTTNIGDRERFNLVCFKPISSLVTGDPVPVYVTVNGNNVPLKNALALPLMSNRVPLGKTCGRYVVDSTSSTPETYIILKTPCYA